MNIAYQLKNIIGAISFMVNGISLKATKISLNVAAIPFGDFLIFSFSSSVSGISFVVFNVQTIELMDTTEPIIKAITVVVGSRPILPPSEMDNRLINKKGVR